MKLSLVVAQGVHQGKVIPVPTPQFLIGRDPQCQLRPASEIVSKRHCALLVREGKVVVRDFGSTNGTFVNGEAITDEREVSNGDLLKVGPLEFTVRVEGLPAEKKAVAGKAKSAVGGKAKPAAAATAAPPKSEAEIDTTEDVALGTEAPSSDPHSDRIAAMLLGLGGEEGGLAGGQPAVPEGTTVLDMQALPDPNAPAKPDEKKPEVNPHAGNTSGAAEAILKKYMRRPRG
jgi:predicted component of type VI protein secretion system